LLNAALIKVGSAQPQKLCSEIIDAVGDGDFKQRCEWGGMDSLAISNIDFGDLPGQGIFLSGIICMI
jgi:hypothetical protein